MFFNHCFQFFYIHLCCNMFNIYKLFIYTQIEVIIFVQHISNSATHTCREVFTGFPKNCYTSSGHIFTSMIANTFHNGFVTAIGMTGENTVVLKDDGTYEYTKRLMQTAEDGTVTADIVYTFTGTYTKDGDTVVLMFPTAGTASENWGSLAGSYFQNTENAAFADSDYAAGVVQCKEAESHLIADLFEGPYLLDNLTTSDAAFDAEECTVTITISGDTFDYVVTNSDDD